jgi:F-type H+-transporting ATPase subunit a
MKRLRRPLAILLLLALVAADLAKPLRVQNLRIELRPETLWSLGPWHISNSLLTSWLAALFLVLLGWRATRRMKETPAAGSLQNVLETILEALYNFSASFGGEHTLAFFPVIGTFFLFILTANWLSLMPGMGSVGYWVSEAGHTHFIPLLRGPTTDLNTTLALAIFSVGACQVYSLRYLGLGHFLGRFFAIDKFIEFGRELIMGRKPSISLLLAGALDVFIGLLEIFEEATKVLSFSFRLFGNMFGGEVLLAVMAFLMPYLASLPFLMLEMFSGFIQAVIFATLSTAFFARASVSHHRAKAVAAPPEGEPTAPQPAS